MKKQFLLFISLALVVSSCQKDDIKPVNDGISNTLTAKQKILKTNLNKAALILAQVVNTNEVKEELAKVFFSKTDVRSIKFKELIDKDSKTSKHQLPLFSKKVNELFTSTKDNEDLVNYLCQNGCKVYVPYPLDWYTTDKTITVAGHPIENDVEGIGYVCTDSKTIQDVMVNEDYADANPVMLIMPEEPGDDAGGGESGGGTAPDPDFGEFGTGPNSIHTVYIGYVWLNDYCGGLFEGDIELRISRLEPYFNTTTNSVEVGTPTELSIKYPKEYVKAIKKGYTIHCNGGWLKVNAIFDTDWKTEEERQGIFAYDYDWDASLKKISIGVTYKGVGLNISLEKECPYKGDFLGKNDQWWRTWFYASQLIPSPYDEVKYGCIVRSLGSLKFTTPTYTLHY